MLKQRNVHDRKNKGLLFTFVFDIGLTLYELHAALYFIAKAEFQTNVIDSDQLKIDLDEVLRLLEEAQEILLFDSPHTPEASL